VVIEIKPIYLISGFLLTLVILTEAQSIDSLEGNRLYTEASIWFENWGCRGS